MALIPTLLALGVGALLGLRWGGRPANIAVWRPPLWQAPAVGVTLLVVLDVLPVSGAVVASVRILALGAVLAFAVVNIRVGGMVLVVVGVGLNLVVTVLNWATPVSGSALVSAGIVAEAELGDVVLHGGRQVADGAVLGFLGGIIPLPWGQVISIGDVIILLGIALVTSSVMRRYEVGGGSSTFGGGSGRMASQDYRSALDALGRGPAPRRGPGLHPSRLPRDRPPAPRRRPGSAPR